eukprot:Protomagalhaensia_sp_Gyna_25__3025@NODE_2790_length_887_cov_606_213443_g2328_i0_p1_GENE_NODE_2790_length_887_cov_606_213443_g2328_i0NODE_2790_length_887_cov_606_213443_g2328_i0_p1_ORF_typecomplete_len202_score36_17Profilin/PF00235_19/0_019_NODE_2790_length_887_cov_606_213443_g2328_i0165770
MAQPSAAMKSLIKERLTQLPGPQGNPENEAYMAGLVDGCDALAMFASDGSVMWAWSQDKMNGWYWHCDLKQDDNMYASHSYDYVQGDGSKVHIEDETSIVAKFMAGTGTSLFFNGSKFHLTQKDTEDNITWAVMGSAGGRGLHCAITPDKDCMVVGAASQKALPTEQIMGVESSRPTGSIIIDARALAGQFRAFAPGALGI